MRAISTTANDPMTRKITYNLLLALLLGSAGCSKKQAPAESKAETKAEENIVTLTKENLAQVKIETAPVVRGNLRITLKAPGRLSNNLNKTAKVFTTLEGRLTKLNFDLGDPVKPGDVLASIETPELLGRPLELKAPIAGVITERKSTVGELVKKESEVYTISDPTQLWVITAIKEREVGAVKVGQEASFTTLAFHDEKFAGRVARVGNEVDAASRTLEVRIETENRDQRLKSGMFADVEITTTTKENVLLVPDAAIQTNGEEQIVFIARNPTTFEKRTVKLGQQQDSQMEILEGVKEGEKIVTEGGFIVKSEMLRSEMESE